MTSVALLSRDGGTGLAVLALPGQAPVRNVLVPLRAPKHLWPLSASAGAGLQPRGASASLCLGLGGCACGYSPCKTSPGLPGCSMAWRNPGVGVGGQPPWGC